MELNLPLDFKDFLKLLNEKKVKYLLIGGYAVGLGIPLATTCRQDHFRGERDDQRVHFDLQQYKSSFWKKKSRRQFQMAVRSGGTRKAAGLNTSKSKIDKTEDGRVVLG
ncbi:hypothetical protein IH575_00540 [Candidatus Dojkabacteria bacterium]|nr:hypothetical protein [Candidatus Dojkabacteria bacterium]